MPEDELAASVGPLRPTRPEDWVASGVAEPDTLQRALSASRGEMSRALSGKNDALLKTLLASNAVKAAGLTTGQIGKLSPGACTAIGKLLSDSSKTSALSSSLANNYPQITSSLNYKAEAEDRHRARIEAAQEETVSALIRIIGQNDASERANRLRTYVIIGIALATLICTVAFGVRGCGTSGSGAPAVSKTPSVTVTASAAH